MWSSVERLGSTIRAKKNLVGYLWYAYIVGATWYTSLYSSMQQQHVFTHAYDIIISVCVIGCSMKPQCTLDRDLQYLH